MIPVPYDVSLVYLIKWKIEFYLVYTNIRYDNRQYRLANEKSKWQ